MFRNLFRSVGKSAYAPYSFAGGFCVLRFFASGVCLLSGLPFGRRDHALCFPPKRRGRVPRSIPPQPRFRYAFLSRKAYIAFAGAAFLHDLPFFCERLPDKRRFFRFLMHFTRKKPRIRLGFSPF